MMVAKKKAAPRKRAAKPKPPVGETTTTDQPPVYVMPNGEHVEGPSPRVPAAVPADGTLLRRDGWPTVYVMHEGQRRPFHDALAFTSCGFGWNEIIVLPPEDVDPIPQGSGILGKADLP